VWLKNRLTSLTDEYKIHQPTNKGNIMKPSNLLETQPMDSVFQDGGIEGLVARF